MPTPMPSSMPVPGLEHGGSSSRAIGTGAPRHAGGIAMSAAGASICVAHASIYAAQAGVAAGDAGIGWLAAHEALLEFAFTVIALLLLAVLLLVAFRRPRASLAARDAATTVGSLERPPEKDMRRVASRVPMIVGTAGEYRGVAVPVPAGGLTLGREPVAENPLKFAAESDVSRRHCTIDYDPVTGHFTVTDLGSANGTFVVTTGRRLAANQASRLDAGQAILLGRDNVFELMVR